MACLVQGDANHFVADAYGFVPGAVLRRENVSAVFSGELTALIKSELQGSVVRLQQYVGRDFLILQFRMLPLMTGVLMAADVPPRPAVKTAFLHVGDVIRNKVVAEAVALIYGAPQLASLRTRCNSTARIANAVGVDTQPAVRRIAHENVGAILLSRSGIGIIDVGSRAHCEKQFLAILRKFHGSRPMSAARQIGNMLWFAAQLQIAFAVGQANQFTFAAYIEPL